MKSKKIILKTPRMLPKSLWSADEFIIEILKGETYGNNKSK